MNSKRENKLKDLGVPLGNSEGLLDMVEAENSRKSKNAKRVLSATFNMVAGFGAAFAAKTAVVSFASWAGFPVIATVLASSLAVGVASTTIHHLIDNKKRTNNAQEKQKFFSEKNAKNFMFSSGFALIGGALFLGFDNFADKISSMLGLDTATSVETVPVENTNTGIPAYNPTEHTWWSTTNTIYDMPSFEEAVDNNINDNVENIATAPDTEIDTAEELTTDNTAEIAEQDTASAIPVATAVFSCGDAASSFKDWAAGSSLTDKVIESLARAEAGNPQGVKDLGYFLFNGFGGVAENKELAVEMFKCAAAEGNVQAKIDFAYSMFHGLGQAENKELAFDMMQEVKNSARAEWFIEEWSKMGVSAVENDVVADNIRNHTPSKPSMSMA